MDAATEAIKKVLLAPHERQTKADALKSLRECGVLDSNNEIAEPFKDIVKWQCKR